MNSTTEANQIPSDRRSIRVVNHDPTLVEIIRNVLRDLPYEVDTTYPDPPDVDEIARSRPAVLIIDLVFRQVSRWQLLARLRAAPGTRVIPILLVSDNEDLLRQARADPEQFGGNAYLQVPFDPLEFVATVAHLVENQPMQP